MTKSLIRHPPMKNAGLSGGPNSPEFGIGIEAVVGSAVPGAARLAHGAPEGNSNEAQPRAVPTLAQPWNQLRRALRLHRKEAAAYLGVSISWLDKSRMTGTGPVYILIGGRVVYDLTDLDRFLDERRRVSVSGHSP